MSSRSTSIAIATAVVAMLTPTAAQAFAPGSTTWLSRPGADGLLDAGGGSASITSPQSISDDSRFVLFESSSDALSLLDDDRISDLFRLDRQTGSVVLVSRRDDEGQVHSSPFRAALSGNGHHVAFETTESLDLADTNNTSDIYVRNILNASTKLVSRVTGLGAVGNSGSSQPSIDFDGNRVAFASFATNLTPGGEDVNALSDIFVRTIGGGDEVEWASQSTAAAAGNGSSNSPMLNQSDDLDITDSVDDDGEFVVFRSGADNLDPLATGEGNEVYRRDLDADVTRIVSTVDGSATATGADDSGTPVVSETGRYVAFPTASDLTGEVAGPSHAVAQVLRKDLADESVEAYSRADGAAGAFANAAAGDPAISASGASVLFRSGATNLGDPDPDTDVFRRLSEGTRLLSRRSGAAGATVLGFDDDSDMEAAAISADGVTAAFVDEATLVDGISHDFTQAYVRGINSYETELASPLPDGRVATESGVDLAVAATSADARFTVFESTSDGLVADDGDPRDGGLYLRDALLGTTRLLLGVSAGNATISADGRIVAFTTSQAVVPQDGNGSTDVHVLDVASGTVSRASTTAAGGDLDDPATSPSLNADGTKLAFATGATNVGAGESTPEDDIYVRDLASGTLTWVSQAPSGVPGDDDSRGPSLDASGTKVAFESRAANLVAGDDNADTDVFVRDLVAGTTVVASTGLDGSVGNRDSEDPSLSADGRRVAFVTEADDLVAGDIDSDEDIVVRDLGLPVPTLVSEGAEEPTSTPAISADGSTVAFQSEAALLVGGDTNGEVDIFVRRGSEPVQRVSLADGTGAQLDGSSFTPTLSSDGGCVVFSSRGTSAAPGVPPTPGFDRVLMRAVTGECPRPAPVAPPGPPAGPPGGGLDTVKPVLTSVAMANKRFARTSKPTATSAAKRKAAKKGSAFRFTLSELATVRIVLERKVKGRRVGKSCRKATAKLRKRKSCTRYEARGVLTRKGLAAGKRSVAFSGRLGKKALPLGSYRATLVATDGAGNRSAARRVTFTIVRR